MPDQATSVEAPLAARSVQHSNGPTLLLFSVCFVFAQADKQVLSLLAEPIKHELSLTDTELGLLQGFAFAFFYAIAGIPISQLIDNGRRVRTAAVCVVLWSVATLLCGFATTFLALLLFRAGTAVAEAGLPPAAFSIFSERGSARSISRATATFMLAPFIGGGLALVGGAALLHLFADIAPIDGWSPWRGVFLVLGAAGVLAGAALGFLVREPVRRSADRSDIDLPSLATVVRVIFPKGGVFRTYYAGLTIFTIFLYALIAWFPVLLIRDFRLDAAHAGIYVGSTYLLAGVSGTGASVLLAARGAGVSTPAIITRFTRVALILIPIAIAIPLASSVGAALGLYAVYAFLSASVVSVMVVPMQTLLPNRMQARSIALYSLCTTAIGGSVGPLAVGMIADRPAIGLGGALVIVCGSSLSAAALLFWITGLRCRALTPEWESQEEPSMPKDPLR